MTQLSLLEIAAGCGVRPNMSVLQDVMIFNHHMGNSLGQALKQMTLACTVDPDTQGGVLALTGSASLDLSKAAPDPSGLSHPISLKLEMTNKTSQIVDVQSAMIYVTDSGGFVLGTYDAYQPGSGIFQAFSSTMTPNGSQSGTFNFNWGSSPFNLLVSVHARTVGGTKHHLVRRIPIISAGYPEPVNFASPSPVFIALWDRPVDLFPVWHQGAQGQWLMLGGQIVNLAGSDVSVVLKSLDFDLHWGSQAAVQKLTPAKGLFVWDQAKIAWQRLTPAADGSAAIPAPQTNFVYGFPVQVSPQDRPTVKITMLYTMVVGGKNIPGQAVTVVPVRFVQPTTVQLPLPTPAVGHWYFGNAPDHTTGIDGNGNPTWFDTHANIGERYCYDITAQDQNGKTYSGNVCTPNSDGTHSGDCAINTNFYAYRQPVFAARGGTVVISDNNQMENSGYNQNPNGGTNMVVVDHHDGTIAGYFHLKPGSLTVQKDDPVKAGQKIGEVGNSGGTSSSEPHLHFGFVDINRTGRAIAAPVAFNGLKALDGKPVSVVPGADQYVV